MFTSIGADSAEGVHVIRATRWLAAVLAVVAFAAGCSESEPEETQTSVDDSPSALDSEGAIKPKEGDGTILSMWAGEQWFAGTVPETGEPADESLEPIKIGIISTDEGAIAPFPELHIGIDAAIEFINDELGGVAGRPIETTFCGVGDANATRSQQCAQDLVQEGVQAVLGGVDVTSNASIEVLEENNIPWVGGIPINAAEMESEITFQFSGGSPGAFIAHAEHAHQNGAESIAMMYVDMEAISISIDALEQVTDHYEIDFKKVPFDLLAQDLLGFARQAVEDDPDAVIVGAADFACPKVMQALFDLEYDKQVYYTGGCADTKWTEQISEGADIGQIYNIENMAEQQYSVGADTEIYEEAMGRYQPDTPAQGAATVTFKAAMNLWAIMNQIADRDGADAVNNESIIAAFNETRDEPSFDGHPYTCAEDQIPGFPSLCATQQILIQVVEGGGYEQVTKEWIDVPAILEKTS